MASPFSHAALDSNSLTVLKPFDPLVDGTAKFGDVTVKYEYDIDVLDVGYAYGLTDNLSIGFHLPYYWINNNVDIGFDNGGANLGFDSGGGSFPFEAIAAGGIPLTEDDVQNLIQTQYGFDRVDSWSRDGIGDIVNLELSTRYWNSDALSFGATYTYGFKSKDEIDGDLGFNYSSLEADTDFEEQVVIVEADYSTLPAYREQQSPAPMNFSIAYRERFAGEGPQSGQANPRLYTRWIVVGMDLLF